MTAILTSIIVSLTLWNNKDEAQNTPTYIFAVIGLLSAFIYMLLGGFVRFV